MDEEHRYQIDILLADARLWSMLEWCKDNCRGRWQHQTLTEWLHDGVDRFYFDNEMDYLLFTLRWC
jgi:hypothetical protein